MNFVEVVVVCVIILLFVVIIVHPVLLIEEMQTGIIQTRKEIYNLREELHQIQTEKKLGFENG